jgi:hypothetical protein
VNDKAFGTVEQGVVFLIRYPQIHDVNLRASIYMKTLLQ